MDRVGAAINFQVVARASGVSRQWLYQQPDLRREIEQLRDHGRKPAGISAAQHGTEASLRQRIRSLLDENQRLRSETAELSRGARARLWPATSYAPPQLN